MTFSNNPEKLSLFGGGCNGSATFSELFRLVWRTIVHAVHCRVRSSISTCGLQLQCRKCFTSIAIDRAYSRSSPRRWCDHASDRSQHFRLQAKRRHLLEVLPWLNFTPDTQQVPAERFSFSSAKKCLLFCCLGLSTLNTMKGGTQGFPRHKVSDKQEVLFEDVSPFTAFSIRQQQNAVDGETSSNKTSCLSLTSCLGNPCVPPFIISKCE